MINRIRGADRGGRPAQRVETGSRPAHQGDRPKRERLFRTTFDRAVVGIAHTSPEGHWLRFNQRLCDLLGYTRTELAARTFQDVTHPDDLNASVACLRRLVTGEQDAEELDKRYLRQDGTTIWVHLTISLMRTPEGAPGYFLAMVQDIDERKRLEQERARLLEQERAARMQAECTNAQLQALQALTDTALSHLALDDLLRELLDRLVVVMGVDNVGIFLLDEDGRTLTLRAGRGRGEEHIGRVQGAVGRGISGRIAARRAPLIVDDLAAFLSAFEGGHPTLRETAHSAAGVPLLVEDHAVELGAGKSQSQEAGRLVGVVIVGSATPRRFTAADVQLLQRAADRIALAIDRARLYAAEQDARQRAEAALARAIASEAQAAERAARLHTILETITDGVAMYDAEGHAVQMNRAYRELYAVERLPGYETLPSGGHVRLLDMRDAATDAPLPLEDMPVGRALRGEMVTGPGADIRLRALDGRDLEVNSSAVPLRDGDGRIVGAVLVVHDMTARKQLERERAAARADELAAREASRRMEAFLATAAHDLRAPLTAVVGFISLAQRRTEQLAAAAREASADLARQVEAVRGRLEDADQGAARLTRLLTVLFDTAAIRADRLELRRAPCDLVALVREHVAGQRAAAPGRSIRLHAPAGGGPIVVEADADRVGQVVANFLTNALKYAPPNRPVEVSVDVSADVSAEGPASAGGGWARVTVCDQGPGILEAEQARVWELFHRAPGVKAQGEMPRGSLGLGLYICKAIVEAHGGQVGVESAVGEGSTFWFTLPLAGAHA